MVVITRRTTQSIRMTRASCSLAFRVGRDHGHPLVPYVRVGRRPEMHGVSRGSTTTVATQEVHVPHRPPIRVTRANCSLAFHVGRDHGHQHVPYVRVGRRPEMRGVSRGSTTTVATQEVHVPHRPPIRVTRVSSSLAFVVWGVAAGKCNNLAMTRGPLLCSPHLSSHSRELIYWRRQT